MDSISAAIFLGSVDAAAAWFEYVGIVEQDRKSSQQTNLTGVGLCREGQCEEGSSVVPSDAANFRVWS